MSSANQNKGKISEASKKIQTDSATKAAHTAEEKQKDNAFDVFLKEKMTIDSSIKNLNQLFQKYREEAKREDLKEEMQKILEDALKEKMQEIPEEAKREEAKRKDLEKQMRKILEEAFACFSLRIEFPNYGNSGDKNYVLLNGVNDKVYSEEDRIKIKELLNENETVYEKIWEEIKAKYDIFEKNYIIQSSSNQTQEAVSGIMAASGINNSQASSQQNSTILQQWSQQLGPSEKAKFKAEEEKQKANEDEKKNEYAHSLIKPPTRLEKPKDFLNFLNNMAKTISAKSATGKTSWGFCAMDKDLEGDRFLTYFFIGCAADEILDVLWNKIKEKAYELSVSVRNQHISNLMELVKRETVRSAKAAIMSRNMSHNLGSHVMFYIKQRLESVEKMLQTGTLKDLENANSMKEIEDKIKKKNEMKNLLESVEKAIDWAASKKLKDSNSINIVYAKDEKNNEKDAQNSFFENINDIKNKIGEIKEVITADTSENEMPFLVGLGRFLGYLQERQDFIATIATNYIPYSTTVNFKDAIYDELKPDKRAERHKGPESKGVQAKNLLLDYIAYSEGFTSSDKIKLQFRKGDNDWFDGSGKPEDVPEILRNFNVSLPGGNLGRQAFFSIMENIIRNTAKHDKSKAKGNLIFRFERLNADEITDIEGFCLRDGEKDKESLHGLIDTNCYREWQDDFHYLGITVALDGDAQEAINNIKKCLRREYLTPEGLTDEECRGLKEIRISAAWLRGKEIDDAISINEPPAVAIRKNQEGYLQYIVCLPKPKKVAFVHTAILDESGRRRLKGFGCCDFSLEDIESAFVLRDIANYDLVVVEDGISEKKYMRLQSHTGARILKCNDVEELINVDDVVGESYKRWLKSTLNIQEDKDFPKISILDHADTHKLTSDSLEPYVLNGGTSENNPSYYKDRAVFNTHYPGQPKIEKEINRALYSQACFVESISGGNSTDRLIRHDKRDWEWYAKHVMAGKTKVAIFDERIYGMIMPKGIAMSDSEKEDIRGIIDDFCKEHATIQTSDKYGLVSRIIENNDTSIARSILRESGNSGSGGIKKVDELIAQIVMYKEEENASQCDYSCDYSKVWQYREKGIWAYNIRMKKKGIVQIIGYAAPIKDSIELYSDKYQAVVVAEIIKEENDVKIKPSKGMALKGFDFLTIHQGILDKIYRTLGIIEDSDKCKVTKALYDCFIVTKVDLVTLNESDLDSDDKGYLPQFIIHSGRSKPNKAEMPQHLPFMQFSALDHAVKDCKYTLTELLFSSHYE